jgi:rhamnosyltransferase subunit B
MHFLLTPLGSAGDVHPMMGLAHTLQSRGHDVTLITNEYFKPRADALGIPYVELGTESEYFELTNDPRLWHPFKALPYVLRSLVSKVMRPQFDLVCEHYRPGETVAIASCLGLGARIARDKIGVPLVTVNLQPAVMWSFIAPPRAPGLAGPRWLTNFFYHLGERFLVDPIVCPDVNRFRAELDLPPVRQIPRWWHSPDGVGCLFPDWFARPQTDWPSPLLQSSFPLWDFGQTDDLPPDVAAFLAAGEPPIAFTPGSANAFGHDFFRHAVKICQQLGRRGVLLSHFADHIPADLPDDVAYFPYVPFAKLLPRCCAVVHHGGVGSTAQALQAGIPQLIVALAHDQFDNGERIKRAKTGEWMPAKRFTAKRAAPIIQRLLTSEEVSKCCHQTQIRLGEEDGLGRMAELLETQFPDGRRIAST